MRAPIPTRTYHKTHLFLKKCQQYQRQSHTKQIYLKVTSFSRASFVCFKANVLPILSFTSNSALIIDTAVIKELPVLIASSLFLYPNLRFVSQDPHYAVLKYFTIVYCLLIIIQLLIFFQLNIRSISYVAPLKFIFLIRIKKCYLFQYLNLCWFIIQV